VEAENGAIATESIVAAAIVHCPDAHDPQGGGTHDAGLHLWRERKKKKSKTNVTCRKKMLIV
jgi:hypothetical protein